MRRGVLTAMSVAIGLLALGATEASADTTIGSVTQPVGSSAFACGEGFFAPYAGPALSEYSVPADGKITAWQVNTIEATPDAPLTLLVLRTLGVGEYEVVGSDSERLPSPLPAGEVASFTLADPIAVQEGEMLALSVPSGSSLSCIFTGGSTPEADRLVAGPVTGLLPPGAMLTAAGPSPENVGFVLNVAATLAQPADLSVSTSATSATATVGAPVELLSTLSNAGPGSSSAVTATDVVPAGFAISSAVSSGGTCPVAAQTVTCTIANMPAGGSGFLLITATPSASGSYTNSVSVSGPEEDPDPGNNTATASLTVSAASPTGSTQPTAKAETHCVLPSLAGASQKLAARVLPALGCKAGKVSRKHGPRSKGAVISTSPKPGTYASGRTISLVVSLGPRPKRAKKHRPRRKR